MTEVVLVDTNVLLDLFTDDPQWRSWSERALADALTTDGAGINQIVYAEVSLAFDDAASLDQELSALLVTRLQLPYGAAIGAAHAFLRYRRAGGVREAPLPDFFIGAHAESEGLKLLTRDASRYRTYFPAVLLIAP